MPLAGQISMAIAFGAVAKRSDTVTSDIDVVRPSDMLGSCNAIWVASSFSKSVIVLLPQLTNPVDLLCCQ